MTLIMFKIKIITSILSASSSTKYVTLLKFTIPYCIKSMSLPGVAISISTPLDKVDS